MDNVCFTSVAFGQVYIDQQRRLRKSILDIYPDANILFFEGRLPDASRPFLDSLYGFKVHAVAEAAKRSKRVIWLDPAMILVGKIDRLFEYKIIAVKDDSKLHQSISEKYLMHQNMTRSQLQEFDWHLVGGSFYYFDFYSIVTNEIFSCWERDEKMGYFGSQQEAASEQINSHRYDESCMAFNFYAANLKPQTPEAVGYCIDKNSIFQKKHFK